MSVRINKKTITTNKKADEVFRINNQVYSEKYADYLNKASWLLERSNPSNNYYYSDLLEDTDWKSSYSHFISSKHYRRELDALF